MSLFGIGPADWENPGSDLAVTALKRGQVKRIILTRPVVVLERAMVSYQGISKKVDPYLRPVYDALYQILGKDQTTLMMEREIIEIAPWLHMRGGPWTMPLSSSMKRKTPPSCR